MCGAPCWYLLNNEHTRASLTSLHQAGGYANPLLLLLEVSKSTLHTTFTHPHISPTYQAGDYVNELLLLVSGTAEIRSRVVAADDGPDQV